MDDDKKPNHLGHVQRIAGADEWREYSHNPVLEPGRDDEFDSWAIGSMSVVKVDTTFHMFYEGWKPGITEIGHAMSTDGIHWEKDPANPVLARSETGWDSGATWDAFVLYEDGLFKMWYGAQPRTNSTGQFHWGYAESRDGTRFDRRRLISGNVKNAAFEDDHVAHDPQSGLYYMYYWDRAAEPEGLYRAISNNETDFDFSRAEKVRIDGLDYSFTDLHKFTHVFWEHGKWYMYYGEFKRPHCLNCKTGYATSNDGLNWEVQNGNLLMAQDAEIVKACDNLYLMYYGPHGFWDAETSDVRLAVYSGHLDNLKSG